jgi:hypothetical protein
MTTVPELKRYSKPPSTLSDKAAGSIVDPPPANVQLKAPKMTLTLTADDGSIHPPAVLKFSLTATGYLSASTSGNNAVLTIVPISLRLDNPGLFQKALAAVLKQRGFRTKGDDPDCIPLEQLIRHIVNAVIGPRLSSFVKSFYFPVPIKLFNDIEVVSVGLDIVDKFAVVFATVGIGNVDTRLVTAVAEKPNVTKKARVLELESVASYPNRGLFLLLGQNFFQLLANALLVYSAGKRDGGSWNGFFYDYGWSMRTWSPQAAISGNNLLIAVNVEGKASAEVGIHTHCGDIKAGVGAQADALPARAATQFFFANNSRELWMQFEAMPFTVKWSIQGLPWPLSQILGFLLDLFTNLGVAFISAWGLRWKQKLTTIPNQFPGTQLQYDLSLDQQIVADPSSGDLMAAGSVHFKG